jgi:integrase
MASKQKDVAKLPRDWREKIVAETLRSNAGNDFKAAVAVLHATGCRPEEIAQGVQLAMVGGQLAIRIKGAKVSTTRGMPWRILTIDPKLNEATAHLASLCGNAQRAASVSFNKDSLRVMVSRVAKRVYPRMKTSISPYTFRHAMSADLKSCDALTDEERSRVMGHLSTESLSSYGRRRRGGGGRSPVVSVKTPREPRGGTRSVSPPPKAVSRSPRPF